jgi:transposase InsO family protein
MQKESDTTEAIIEFVKSQERFFIGKGYKVGAIRTDNGGEFVNNEFCTETGISHQLTVAHNSFQSGVVERFHGNIQERTRCLLIGEKFQYNCGQRLYLRLLI